MRSYWIHVVLVCARELPVVHWWFTNHNFLFFNQFDYLARWAIIICNNSIHIFFNPEWLVCWLRYSFLAISFQKIWYPHEFHLCYYWKGDAYPCFAVTFSLLREVLSTHSPILMWDLISVQVGNGDWYFILMYKV